MTAETAPADYSPANTHGFASIESMPLEWIERSDLNPRRHFDEEKLQELADSIKQHGLLEAIVVRPLYRNNAVDPVYIIIAGERRFRAAKLAGLESVPVRVLTGIDDRTHIELALLENLQRQDLDPLEEAAGYRALQEIGYTQTQIAAAVKRSQPAVAKAISLLRLPDDVQELIRQGELSPTHGVALARFGDFPAVCSAVAAKAVQQRATAHDLDGEGVPWYWDLSRAGVIRTLDYQIGFDTDICKSRCPHGAYRASTYGSPLCLRPDHVAELQAEAAAAQATKLAEAKAAVASNPAAARDVVPDLKDLSGVRDLRYTTTPSGCTPQCPCRAQARDGDGRLTAICTNSGRLAQLSAADERAKKKVKRDATAALRHQVDELLSGLQEIGAREMAILATAILSGRTSQPIRVVANKLVPGLADVMASYDATGSAPGILAQQDPLTIMRAALAVVLHDEILQEFRSNTLTEWYTTPPDLPGHVTERIAKLRSKILQSGDEAEVAALRQQIAVLQAKGAQQTEDHGDIQKRDASTEDNPAPAAERICSRCKQPFDGEAHYSQNDVYCPSCAAQVSPGWAQRLREQGRLPAEESPVKEDPPVVSSGNLLNQLAEDDAEEAYLARYLAGLAGKSAMDLGREAMEISEAILRCEYKVTMSRSPEDKAMWEGSLRVRREQERRLNAYAVNAQRSPKVVGP